MKDEEDFAAFRDRVAEPSLTYEALLAQLKAELSPVVSPRASAEALVERWRHLPQVDPAAFRADVDSALDCSL